MALRDWGTRRSTVLRYLWRFARGLLSRLRRPVGLATAFAISVVYRRPIDAPSPLAVPRPLVVMAPERLSGTERRVCSVLFVDLVGFTPFSQDRDPEDVRELLLRYFDAVRTVVPAMAES